MKKRLLIICSVLIVISCQKTHKEVAREKIETYFLKIIDDPDTYEFVSISKLDTVYPIKTFKSKYEDASIILDEIIEEKEKVEEDLEIYRPAQYDESYKEQVESLESEFAELNRQYYEKLSNKIKLQEEYRFVKKKGLDTAIICTFINREKNRMGAKILTTHSVMFDYNLNVISFDNKK